MQPHGQYPPNGQQYAYGQVQQPMGYDQGRQQRGEQALDPSFDIARAQPVCSSHLPCLLPLSPLDFIDLASVRHGQGEHQKHKLGQMDLRPLLRMGMLPMLLRLGAC
jgi:hypothetical protein